MIRLLQQRPGECLQTSIACLLEIDIERVPPTHQWYIVEGWAKDQGYQMVLKPWEESSLDEEGFYIVGGKAKNFPKEAHAVIYKGTQPYFDPNPETGFLVKPEIVLNIMKK